MKEEFLGEESLGEKYVQEGFLGEESLGEKYVGEKSVGEKSLGENRGRWDAGFRSPLLRCTSVPQKSTSFFLLMLAPNDQIYSGLLQASKCRVQSPQRSA